MKKISNTKIKDIILNYIHTDFGLTIKNIRAGNGYFLSYFGKDSVYHFTFKEIPNWKFGLWLISNEEKNELKISFFGEKINWIDKFKPTACTVSNSETITDISELTPESKLFSLFYYNDGIGYALLGLKRYRHFFEYNLSKKFDESFLSWYANEIYQYKIKKPFEKFYESKIIKTICKLCLYCLKVKYRKYIKVHNVFDNNSDGVISSPRYTTKIEYIKGCDDYTINVVSYLINESVFGRYLRHNSIFFEYKYKDNKLIRI